jgi:hypothetical protein
MRLMVTLLAVAGVQRRPLIRFNLFIFASLG